MRILHTADWHLGDRLKHVDRTADLTAAVAKVARYCDTKKVDVLLIAGDLFSDVTRGDACAAALTMLNETFRPFLLRGGTVVVIAGNHDGDRFFEIVCKTSQLAAPLGARQGDVLPRGRWYFATRPCHFRLLDSADAPCHIACLPYPNSVRYHVDEESTFVDSRGKHELLASAFRKHAIRLRSKTQAGEPSVLVAHVAASGANWGDLFRMSEHEDIVIRDESLWEGWDYVALGHLHRPQLVGGNSFVRYSGSIERLDLGERDDQKGVILVEVAPGRAPEPQFLRLDATPFYDVQIRHPGRELPLLRSRFPQADRALVRCHVFFSPHDDNLPSILSEISRIFPRCYERRWSRHAGNPTIAEAANVPQDGTVTARGKTVRSAYDISLETGTVRQVLESFLLQEVPKGDPDLAELLTLLDALLEEGQ